MKAIKFEKIKLGDDIVVFTYDGGVLGFHRGVVSRFSPFNEITLNDEWSMELDEKLDVIIRLEKAKK